MPKKKGRTDTKKQKKNGVTTTKPKMSAGQRRYMFTSDVMKDYESYKEQVDAEKKKIKSRSLWTTLGGVLGAGVAVMLAPAILGGAAAFAGVTALGSVATGLGTAAVVGTGSAFGSKRGMEHSERKEGPRKSIKTEKFYKEEAKSATETFSDAAKDIDKGLKTQAYISGITAGLQAGGAFKKLGELGKKGLGIGPKGTGVTFPAQTTTGGDLLSASKSVTKDIPAVTDVSREFIGAMTPDQADIYMATGKMPGPKTTSLVAPPIDVLAPLTSPDAPTAGLRNLSNKNLLSQLEKTLFSQAVGGGSRYLAGRGEVETDPIQGFDPSRYYV